MFDSMMASRFSPQLSWLNRERRDAFSRTLAVATAIAVVASTVAIFSVPAPAAASDEDSPGPSLQYLEALQHDGEHYSFAQGGVVDVPYRPRPSDTALVDGAAPIALPAAADSGVAAPSVGEATVNADGSINVLRREVYGFLPYWQLGTTLNYSTLSTIAYFGVGLNVNLDDPTDPAIGSLAKRGNGWNGWTGSTMTNVINQAHAAGTRVALTIESFAWNSEGAAFQSQILGTDEIRVRTAQAIAAEVQRRGVDGVNLDFEPIASGQYYNFVTFVQELRVELDKIHPGYELVFCANGSGGSYELHGLLADGAADAVFIMGYDLRGGNPSTTGSIDPLVSNNNRYTLTSITNYFLSHGAPAAKTILGLPWESRAWSVGLATPPVLNAPPASITTYGQGATGVTYTTAMQQVAKSSGCADPDSALGWPQPCVPGEQYDPVEETAWVAYYGDFGGTQQTWRELYYDNPRSLGAKCDFIDSKDLRGLGIWALGYDNGNGNGELTNEVAVKYLEIQTPATYHAIEPARLLDTRIGNGLSGKFWSNVPRTVLIAGRRGIPRNATAITANVTVVNPSYGWAVYVGPEPIASPKSSTVNFARGQTIANGITAALGRDGTLSATFMSIRGQTTDLVLDVTGYYMSDDTGATYHTMAPQRILDTRSSLGLSGKLTAAQPRAFKVAGAAGVPDDAVAVTGNLTATGSTSAWAVYLGSERTETPATSTLNFLKGQSVSNNVTVALDPDGQLWATYLSSPGNTTDLVFDVTGYYTADATGARFVPMSPFRLVDTRSKISLSGKFPANSPRTFPAAGRGGVAYDAVAITGNLTVVNQSSGWAMYVGPQALAKPTTSTLNFVKGEIRSNGFAAEVSSDGKLSATYISNGGNSSDLVLDVTGYFVP
jgi:spore germination protein YaaH